MKSKFFAGGRSLFGIPRGAISGGRGRNAGQVAVIVAISLPVLVGIVGVTVEAGQLRAAQRQMEIAADAGALAGALQMQYMKSISSTDFSSVPTSARTDTAKNGFTNGTNGVTVTVNVPPASGSYTASTSAVEVIVAQTRPTYLLGLLGFGATPVRARAVAAMWSGPNCIYALDPGSTSGALQMTPKSGGYSVNAGCGIVVNSNAKDAILTNGNTLTAKTIGVVGSPGYSGTPAPSPIPTTGINAVSDPLAYVKAPTPAGTCIADPNVTSGAKTLSQGTYCKLTIDGSACPSNCATPNPPNVKFNSGTYIIEGAFAVKDPGGCKCLSGDQATDNKYYPSISGTGVTFYMTGTTSKGKTTYGDVVIGGGKGHWTNARLSAPTTGTYAGILFFQDRMNASPGQQLVSFGVDPTCANPVGLEGALYFPNAALKLNNSSSCVGATFPKYTIVVAKDLDFYRDYGNFLSLGYDTSGLSGGSPIQKAVLVE